MMLGVAVRRYSLGELATQFSSGTRGEGHVIPLLGFTGATSHVVISISNRL